MVFPSKVSLLQQVDSGIPQTIQRGHRNPPVLRTSCFRSTTVISHLLKLFLIFPDLGGFTLSLYVEHLGEVWLHLQKKPQVQGTLAVGHEQAHSPTILTLFFHFLVLPTELLFLIHSHSLFFFFFPFSFSCLTGRGCLSVARACMQGGSVKSPCQKLMKCVQGN